MQSNKKRTVELQIDQEIKWCYSRLGRAVFERAVQDARLEDQATLADQLDALEWLELCGYTWLADFCGIGVKPSEYSAFLATLPEVKPEPILSPAAAQFGEMVKMYVNQYIQSLQPVA
jgi:hypothetical protein